jgi:iron complex transport system ATP-binding protein
MSAAIFCENLGFSFSGEPCLKNITFSLEKGAYLSIIGPNGAGKSTLLKIFLRLHGTGHARGLARVHGCPLASYSQRELARLIAYVPQAGDRLPPLTVAEFLQLSRYPYAFGAKGLSAEDREALDKALAHTDMTRLAARRLDTLSGGERQKAFLAAALAQGAGILLLDEPASSLDPKHAAEVSLLLKTLNREQGITMLTVTHDLNHPLDAGGQTLVLRRGEQIFFGPSDMLTRGDILEAAFNHTFTFPRHPATGKTLVLADQP